MNRKPFFVYPKALELLKQWKKITGDSMIYVASMIIIKELTARLKNKE